MAGKGNKSTTAPAENVVAKALRVAAGTLRASAVAANANADSLDAFAAMYDDAAGAAPPASTTTATPVGHQPDTARANMPPGPTPGAGPPSRDTVKTVLMDLVKKATLANPKQPRALVDPILERICGSLMSVKDIPEEKLQAVLDAANASLAAPAVGTVDL